MSVHSESSARTHRVGAPACCRLSSFGRSKPATCRRSTLLLLAVIALAARAATGASLQFSVRHTFNGAPLLLDSLRYQNAAGETLSVTRLSYLLSDFALERADGSWLELTNEVAWMDASQGRASIGFEGLAADSFRSIRFQVGLGTNLNHADPAKVAPGHPLNPNLNGLHWNWQGGYIFLALEGLYRSGARNDLQGYAYHFARDPNLTRINLPVQLDLSHDTAVFLDFDLAALLNAPRRLSFRIARSEKRSREFLPWRTTSRGSPCRPAQPESAPREKRYRHT